MQNSKKQPSQRQLRVGEEIRHVLSSIFLQNTFYEPSLIDISITVPEVRVSPDLRKATAYVYPLGGKNKDGFISDLNKIAPKLSYQVSQKASLKYSPNIYFKLDNTYEVADNIETLINSINEE